MQYLSFSDLSHQLMGSTPIHAAANGKMPFFLIGGKYSLYKRFCTAEKKEKNLQNKKMYRMGGKFCKTYVSNKGLISRIYKELIQPNNNNKKTNPTKSGAEEPSRHLSTEGI